MTLCVFKLKLEHKKHQFLHQLFHNLAWKIYSDLHQQSLEHSCTQKFFVSSISGFIKYCLQRFATRLWFDSGCLLKRGDNFLTATRSLCNIRSEPRGTTPRLFSYLNVAATDNQKYRKRYKLIASLSFSFFLFGIELLKRKLNVESTV